MLRIRRPWRGRYFQVAKRTSNVRGSCVFSTAGDPRTVPLDWRRFTNVADRTVMRGAQAALVALAVGGLSAADDAWGVGSEGSPHYFLLDVRGDGFDLSGTNRNAGTRWTRVMPDDGLLAVDASGLRALGVDISNAGQARLEGVVPISSRLRVVANGQAKEVGNSWQMLAVLDANGDGKLDTKDPSWNHLRIFVDRNGDGSISDTEVRTVTETGIRDISARTGTSRDGRTDTRGNSLVEGAFPSRWLLGEVGRRDIRPRFGWRRRHRPTISAIENGTCFLRRVSEIGMNHPARL